MNLAPLLPPTEKKGCITPTFAPRACSNPDFNEWRNDAARMILKHDVWKERGELEQYNKIEENSPLKGESYDAWTARFIASLDAVA
jgi:hypothetical protein